MNEQEEENDEKIDIESLLVLGNNESLLKWSMKKVLYMKYKMVKQLLLGREKTREFMKKLNGYRYIDNIMDLTDGSFIRWVPMIDPSNLPIHYMGIKCQTKLTDDGMLVVCKNYMHRYYTFKMSECLVFQKMSEHELYILRVLDMLRENGDLDKVEDEECLEVYEEDDDDE